MLARSVHDLDSTRLLATALASAITPGCVLLLDGPIGAGKTTFIGFLAAALGGTEPVRSPTYTIAHEYGLAPSGTLAHLDLYRHQGELQAGAWADIEPYFDAPYVAVEWPAPIGPWLSAAAQVWRIELEPRADTSRVAWVQAPDPAGARSLSAAIRASHALIP